MIETIFFVIGSTGLVILLTAFILLEKEKISRHSKEYLTANIIGSLLLGVYAFYLQAWPFVILETIWAFFALSELNLFCSQTPTR